MALPFPLLALVNAFVNPQFGVSFSPWNYWYALLLAVMLSLMGACVANADARLKLHPRPLSAGTSPARSWWAKAIWCLALSLVSNLVVFAIYAAATVVTGEASAAGVATMLAAVIVITITSSWMIPATLFLTARFGNAGRHFRAPHGADRQCVLLVVSAVLAGVSAHGHRRGSHGVSSSVAYC